VFPHSKRILEIPLSDKPQGEDVPVEVTVQFAKFKLEQKLQRVKTAESVTSAQASAPASSSDAPAQPSNRKF